MMHRFAGSGGVPWGHDPQRLRAALAHCRASGIRLLRVQDAIARYAESKPGAPRGLPPAVAFTVDDGYRDFATIGMPVFAEFDCPVTCYTVPEVIDGKRWYWWDQIDWLLRRFSGPEVTLDLAGEAVVLRDRPAAEAGEWQERLVERAKAVSATVRDQFLVALAAAVGHRLPAEAPEEYGVMSWHAMRAAEGRGVEFGAHTMTHPILSQCTDDQARQEIVDSARRMREELAAPSAVFCYPFGRLAEFSDREGPYAEAAGFDYAVCAEPGIVDASLIRTHGDRWRWRVPRFAFENRPGIVARHLLF